MEGKEKSFVFCVDYLCACILRPMLSINKIRSIVFLRLFFLCLSAKHALTHTHTHGANYNLLISLKFLRAHLKPFQHIFSLSLCAVFFFSPVLIAVHEAKSQNLL